MLLIKFLVNRTKTPDNQQSIHTRCHLYLIVIECVEFQHPVFANASDHFIFFVAHGKVSVNKVSSDSVGRWWFEESSDTKSSLSFHVHVKCIRHGNEFFLDPTNLFAIVPPINIVGRRCRNQFAIQNEQFASIFIVEAHLVLAGQVKHGPAYLGKEASTVGVVHVKVLAGKGQEAFLDGQSAHAVATRQVGTERRFVRQGGLRNQLTAATNAQHVANVVKEVEPSRRGDDICGFG